MFAIDAGKFTSKPDPRKEFVQYFKDSGAAAALQKAMALLYRMPVKPENLAEYFSEYFDNGAQRLMRISLLQAELCYKKDELEHYNNKVQASENRILELLNKLGISEEEFNERFLPEEIKENNRLSILERYFKDLERGTRAKTVAITTPTVQVDDVPIAGVDVDIDRTTAQLEAALDLQVIRSDVDVDDHREMDPWGIICRPPALHPRARGSVAIRRIEEKERAEKAKRAEELKRMNEEYGGDFDKMKFGLQPTPVEGENEMVADDDDGATLADVYHQFAYDSNLDQDEAMLRLHNQLLTVKKPDTVPNFADLMGWRPSRGDVTSPVDGDEEVVAARATHGKRFGEGSVDEGSIFEKNFDENYTDIEKLRRKPCQKKVLKVVQGAMEDDTDAFLFEDIGEDELIENAYKMMEMDGFVFDFPEFSPSTAKHEQGVCKPVCSPSAEQMICSRPTTGGLAPSVSWTGKSPGTGTSVEGGDEAPGSSVSGREDVPIVRVDSSCHCLLRSTYSANELYDADGESIGKAQKKESNARSSKNRRSSARERYDEEAIAEDAALTKELDEVFKKNRKRSSGSKNKNDEKIDDEVQDTRHSHVYSVVDLAKEIARTFLGPPEETDIDPTGTAHALIHNRQLGQGDQIKDSGDVDVIVPATKNKRKTPPTDPNAATTRGK